MHVIIIYSLQCTGSNTEDDENDDAYVELGGVTSVDLISFAYQITSGMVRGSYDYI